MQHGSEFAAPELPRLAVDPPMSMGMLGQMLLTAGLVGETALRDGLALHRRVGVPLGEALISLGHVRPDQVARALAQQQGLAVFDPHHTDMVHRRLGPPDDAWFRRQRIVPMLADDGVPYLVTSEPTRAKIIEQARRRLGGVAPAMIATNRDLEHALHGAHRADNIRLSAERLREHSPDSSADVVMTGRQKAVTALLIAALPMALLANWAVALTAIVSVLTLCYMASSGYMLYLLLTGWARRRVEAALDPELRQLDERELPIYTILVPLYHEAAVLPQLARAIQALDWPKVKLDVRLLLEEDDLETIQAAREARLPAYFTFVIVPKEGPRGKPKACNYGLAHARGEFVVIFDAEDIPEPDQLKKVYAAFSISAPGIACIQCRLNFYNPEQNLLTRWFTSDYSLWFDLLLPGLQQTGAPIPLGGTSNHFRRAVLEDVGAWDAYNVTEDADLGIRLFKRRWRTLILDSTTYEEANPEIGNWIRQRSRWIKGYAQTWLVHMRHPIALWRVLGTAGFWGFQGFVGGRVLVLLLNPFYWGLTALWFLTHSLVISSLFPAPVFYLGSLALYVGNMTFLYLSIAGTLSRGYYRLVKYALLSPLYWVLMSIAAWKGVLQLLYRPHYWEKTRHGLATGIVTMGGQGGPTVPSKQANTVIVERQGAYER